MNNNWHVATAAEAITAAQFSRCGWDVSVQYGANQPEYDLVVVNRDKGILKISVKGSRDGSWGLTQSYLQGADYHMAVDTWLGKHDLDTVFCLVQFKDVLIDRMPRMYLAKPSEIAAWLKAAANGRGDTVLHERHEWSSRAQAAGTVDEIPAQWTFSIERIDQLANSTTQ